MNKMLQAIAKGVKTRNEIALSPEEYLACFEAALGQMAQWLYGDRSSGRLQGIITGEKLSAEAAENDFYSRFKYDFYKGKPRIAYQLTRAFFQASYEGLAEPTESQRRRDESPADFLRDCATNYLLKNFWHNHVHAQTQRITDANYREFGGEARYMTDFETDNFANILLAHSNRLELRADRSDITGVLPGFDDLNARNRCNEVFRIRADLRTIKQGRGSVDSLLEKEWLIRRSLVNELSCYVMARGRAVASISMHFFGPITRQRQRYFRRTTSGAVQLNGIWFPLGNLEGAPELTRAGRKTGIEALVRHVDVSYANALRNSREMKSHAESVLRSKIRLLVGRTLSGRKVKARAP